MAIEKEWGNISNIYVDSANPVYWQPLKQQYNQRHDEQQMKNTIAMCKEYNVRLKRECLLFPLIYLEMHGIIQLPGVPGPSPNTLTSTIV